MSDRLTYQNVVEELLRRVPTFASVRNSDDSYVSQDDDSPHLVFADFARFLLEHLSSQTREEEVQETLARSFKLLDEMLTSPDPEVANVAEVGVFEAFAEQPTVLAIARSYLSEEANLVVEEWTERWLNWCRFNKGGVAMNQADQLNYVPVRRRSRDEIGRSLSSGDVQQIRDALISAAYWDDDWKWRSSSW